MSFLDAIKGTAKTYADAFQVADITTLPMQNAINNWFALYQMQAATEDSDPCQQIPYTIVRKITKACFSEYWYGTQDAYAGAVLAGVEKIRKKAMQLALIGGECMIKPIPKKNGWDFTTIPRYGFMVFGRDNAGGITDAGSVEITTRGKWVYSLLERRSVDEKGYLRIQNMLFRSDSANAVGTRVPLAELPGYADLPDDYTYTVAVGSIGLIQVKTPVENNIDFSMDGVSVYSAAVGLIQNINKNEAQLSGEFSRGESRIITSSDFMKREKDGSRSFSDHIFVGLDDDPDTVGVTVFSPELRDESFKRRLQGYLRSCESVIGLKRGILSEVEAVERTATEVTSSEGDYNLTIIDFQEMWTDAVKEAMRVCGVLGQIYKVDGAKEIKPDDYELEYGNGVLYDRQKALDAMRQDVNDQILKPEIYLGERYGQPWETEEDRAKIRKEYMPDILDNAGAY